MSSDELWTLREFMDSLPQGHHERAGLARAIELLNLGVKSREPRGPCDWRCTPDGGWHTHPVAGVPVDSTKEK